MNRINRNKSEGFSLLEVIIALGIAAISVSSLIIFFSYAMQSIRISRSMAQATTLAQRQMEELKANPGRIMEMADDPLYVAGPVETAEILYNPETFELGSPRIPIPFFITTTAERIPETGGRVIDILVEVRWRYQGFGTTGDPENKKVILESYYISDY